MVLDISGIRIDTISRRVSVRGRKVRLGPLAFDFLLFLMQNANKILSQEAIIANLWQGQGRDRQASNRLLAQCVSRVRRAVEENPKKPKLVVTRYGQGYVFAVILGQQASDDQRRDPLRVELDKASTRVKVCGREAYLTPLELRLLECLMERRGIVCEDALLIEHVWGHADLTRKSRQRLISVVHNLRVRLGDAGRRQIIERVWNAGYRYTGH